MKKIDLHIHTVSSISDHAFEFSLEALIDYVTRLEIDCIAITNHNLFDIGQFNTIIQSLTIKVLPGIEIDLESGHLLLISENTELEDFAIKCKKVQDLIPTDKDCITVETLKEIFPDLNKYLLIPHYEKSPVVNASTVAKLSPHIFAGEVTSTRKFKACSIDAAKLTPVIFSDVRISTTLTNYPSRQTFVDLSEVTLRGIKSCLTDKSKVSLSKEDGNDFFPVTDDGLQLSTGLNVMLGERSTGKTHSLERILTYSENVKYIKQFALLQNDEEKFKNLLSTRHSTVNEQFLKEFKEVVSDVNTVDLKLNKLDIEKYLSTLIKFASDSDKQDSYSKATLFSETLYEEASLDSLKKIIDSTINLIENTEYRDLIDVHLKINDLKTLAVDLIKRHQKVNELNLHQRWVNDLVKKVKEELKLKTSTTPPSEIDFYHILIENEKVKKFIDVATAIQKEREIDRKEIRGFKIVAKTKKYTGAQQLKNKSGRNLSFANSFSKYSTPSLFLSALKELELASTDYYKYFVDIEYQTLNKHNYPVSGGERSEFNLLHEIGDALQYDLLLIDEPESSFDNLFLKNDVNELLKSISKEIPVVIVTHNSTVGASINPDYILYTKKSIVGSDVKYQIFCGYPSDKHLKCNDGEAIENYEILLSCLEAGTQAYDDRRNKTYEILKS